MIKIIAKRSRNFSFSIFNFKFYDNVATRKGG